MEEAITRAAPLHPPQGIPKPVLSWEGCRWGGSAPQSLGQPSLCVHRGRPEQPARDRDQVSSPEE